MHALDSCSYSRCTRPISTIFRHEPLCLEHFCRKSYEFLDSVDQHLQSNSSSHAYTPEQLHIADECARKTLDICLSKMILNNLDRARLLDILLWSGDIVSCSRSASTAAANDNARTRYESPQFRTLGTGGARPN